jgi:hypothetical protein
MISTAQRAFDVYRANTRDFGVCRALQDVAIRAVNRAVYFRIFRGIVVTSAAGEGRIVRYRHGFVERDALLSWAMDPAYEMSREFVLDALAMGSRCYAIWDGSTLASYGWYSSRPTPVSEDLWLCFDPAYVYMYKGFTHARYRGQRLHAIGMMAALETSRAEGSRGLVSYVESNNFASLRSCYRMGYRNFGWIAFVKAGHRYVMRASAGCRRYRFRLEHRPASAPSTPALRRDKLPAAGPS